MILNTKEIIAKEDKYQLTTYRKFPIALVRGEGMRIYDSDNKEYLDFYGGHAVAITGHCHPKLVEAIQKQAERLIFYSNVAYNDVRAEVSELLISIAPEGISQVFLCNSGSGANETALKMARKFTDREYVISMKGGFHGRTIGSLSATGIERYRIFKPLLTQYKFAEFGDIKSIEELVDDEVAAIILEPVQSIAGAVTASPEYYRRLREICDEKGIVLIFDEVQTAFGRTGKMFAGENWGVIPDLITTAKGIASGVPMGAVLVKKEIAETISYGEQGTTFGGGPLACAAAKASLNIVLEERLFDNAKRMGDYIGEKLRPLKHIVELRGLGLLIGVVFDMPIKEIRNKLLERGFIVGSSADPQVMRVMPPLIVKKEEVDLLTSNLREIVEAID